MMRALLLLLAFILLCFWCINRDAQKIEQDVLSHAQATLIAENKTDVIATIDGRDILLTGQVDTEEERQQLITAIAETEGVRIVDHTLALTPKAFPRVTSVVVPDTPTTHEQPVMDNTIATPEPEVTSKPVAEETTSETEPESVEAVFIDPGITLDQVMFTISKSDGNVNLGGYLPDQNSKDKIIDQISNNYIVKDDIKITSLDGNWPTNWQLLNSAVLSQVLKLKLASASVRPETIVISGQADSHSIRDDIEKLLRQSLPSTWTLDFNISIPLSETTVACEAEIQNLLSDETIYFRLESADIDQASVKLLDSIIGKLKTCTAASFLIEGHTDSIGDEKYNQLLSEKRAQAVKDYLILQGIEHQRIKIKGYGESRPIASNSTVEGRSKNRRIEFVVLGESL